MPKVFFPTVEEALAMHEILIQRFGGSQGVREMGLVSSAIHRPQSGYYESLFEQAAALLESFALNHCFVDGNKRIAFGMTDVFLRLNGKVLKVEASEAEKFLIHQVIAKKIGIEKIAAWLEEHT